MACLAVRTGRVVPTDTLVEAVLQIVGWALVAGRRAGWTWLRAGAFAAVEGALGVVLLLLERLVH